MKFFDLVDKKSNFFDFTEKKPQTGFQIHEEIHENKFLRNLRKMKFFDFVDKKSNFFDFTEKKPQTGFQNHETKF